LLGRLDDGLGFYRFSYNVTALVLATNKREFSGLSILQERSSG
jgi:hypothetical protein